MKGLRHALELACAACVVPFAALARALGWNPRGVTIVGWWGSETVGDVAILGQLLAECRMVSPHCPVTVVSFDAALTRASLRELEREDVALRTTGPRSAWALVGCRAQIVGGGPLMESPSMAFWAWRARLARAAGARVVLYGNGIGPVRTTGATRSIVRLLRAASHLVVRDATAQRWCDEHAARRDVARCFDPAFDYVRDRRPLDVTRRPTLALALRSVPDAYYGAGDATAASERVLVRIAEALDALGQSHDLQFAGIVMQTGFTDSDDAAVYTRLRRHLREPERLQLPASCTVDDVARILAGSRGALTMRFHAMIFALATDTPFVAIDYARPTGKVSAAAADVGRAHDVLEFDALDSDALETRLRAMLDGAAPPPLDVSRLTAARQALLQDALR